MITFNRFAIQKGAIAIAAIGSAVPGLLHLQKQDYPKQLAEAAHHQQVQDLGERLSGILPLVPSTVDRWSPVFAVDIGEFCRQNPGEVLTKNYGAGFANGQLPALAGYFKVCDVEAISKPFSGVALLLQSLDRQEIGDSRPFAVWWLVQMPNAQASAVRQVIANSTLKTANLHFDAQTPLVPVNWIQSGGFTVFAAVTPRNIRGDEISQVVSPNRLDDPSSYTGNAQERYQAALTHWEPIFSQKQREWEAKATELREKLLAATGKPNDQAIRDEVSEAATEAKAEKDAWMKAHPQPAPVE
jgi:hypothetical protein